MSDRFGLRSIIPQCWRVGMTGCWLVQSALCDRDWALQRTCLYIVFAQLCWQRMTAEEIAVAAQEADVLRWTQSTAVALGAPSSLGFNIFAARGRGRWFCVAATDVDMMRTSAECGGRHVHASCPLREERTASS